LFEGVTGYYFYQHKRNGSHVILLKTVWMLFSSWNSIQVWV